MDHVSKEAAEMRRLKREFPILFRVVLTVMMFILAVLVGLGLVVAVKIVEAL